MPKFAKLNCGLRIEASGGATLAASSEGLQVCCSLRHLALIVITLVTLT